MNKKVITLLLTSFLLASCGSSTSESSSQASTSASLSQSETSSVQQSSSVEESSEEEISSEEESSEELSSEEVSSEEESSEEITSEQSSSEEIKRIENLTATGYKVRHTDIQLRYLDSENYTDTTPYDGNLSKSAPVPVALSWDAAGESDYIVKIFEGEDLSNEVVRYVTSDTSFNFYNTKLNQTYTIVIESEDRGVIPSEPITFTSDARGPRNLYVEGVENVRDLAGFGHMKQGMIYRSGRFNEDKKDQRITIGESGIYEMNNHLKIKTEIDLRRTSNNEVGGLTDTSPLGEDVKYIQLPMYYGGNNILTFVGKASGDTYEYDNPKEIANFFDILSDETNYPIDFHCSIGKDRTGCLAYLVEGLLGANEEELMRDYMFTNFSKAGMCKPTDITNRYGKTLSEYEKGDTLQEKIYNYLINEVNIPQATLDSVIDILSI